MRIVVLGDIHGNLEALGAVLAEAGRSGADLVLHTGDLVGYGPRPNETVDTVRRLGIAGVRGNFDQGAAWGEPWSGAGGGEARRATAERAIRWTLGRLGYAQRNFLQDLPFSLDRQVGGRRLSLFHASPTDLFLPIEPHTPQFVLEELASGTGADLHLFGHTHSPFHRVVNGRHFINAGSVGRPEDGDPRACMTIVELDGGVSVEFRRIPYDVEATAREIEACGLPEEVARGVRTGR